MPPRASIGLPVRNGENYLADALDSIRSQTFEDFDVLVSDNGSDDRTAEIARDYASSDKRIRYHRQETNLGASANYNYSFRNTSGEFFHWAAHDDILAPTFLQKCIEVFDKSPRDVVLVYPQTLLIDADGNPLRSYSPLTRKGGSTPAERLAQMIGPGDHSQSLLHMCFPVFGLIRRSALDQTSLIANMPRSDDLLLVQLALLGAFAEIDEELFLRREHAKGSVISAEAAARGPQLEKLLAAWFDPKKGRRFPATYTRLGIGYLSATLRTPMQPGEKLKSVQTVLGWTFRMKKTILRELAIVAREAISP